MDIHKMFEIKIKIILNNNLYKNQMIDEETYSKVNEKLLGLLKGVNKIERTII